MRFGTSKELKDLIGVAQRQGWVVSLHKRWASHLQADRPAAADRVCVEHPERRAGL